MMTSNNALVPDPDKFDVLASTPSQWPWLNVGLRMCGWGDNQVKYYLLGNPIVWWSSTSSLIIGVLVFLTYLLRWQRKYNDLNPGASPLRTCELTSPHLKLNQRSGNSFYTREKSLCLDGFFITVRVPSHI